MSAPRDKTSILADRLALVLAIGEANAARQRAQAAFGGAQIEMMRVEDDSEPARQAALAADAEARSALDAADARIETLEIRLAALDAELTDADR
jgi:hypothetical protein